MNDLVVANMRTRPHGGRLARVNGFDAYVQFESAAYLLTYRDGWSTFLTRHGGQRVWRVLRRASTGVGYERRIFECETLPQIPEEERYATIYISPRLEQRYYHLFHARD